MSTNDTGPPTQGPPTARALPIAADAAPERQSTTTKLTVIPAVFEDSEAALAAMVDAKRTLDTATKNLRERERANAQKRAERSHVVRSHAGVDEDYQRDQAFLQPVFVEVERARAEYDVAFAIYQETARARDAQSANRLAESNNAVAATNSRVSTMIAWVTLVIAIAAAVQTAATILQVVHTWSK